MRSSFATCGFTREGGVYLDVDVVLAAPLREMLRPSDEFVAVQVNGSTLLHTSFVAVVPSHPVMWKALLRARSRVEKRCYGEAPDDIVGSRVLSRAFFSLVDAKEAATSLLLYRRPEGCAIGGVYDKRGLLLYHAPYVGYKADMSWYIPPAQRHDVLFEYRLAYNTERPRRSYVGRNDDDDEECT